jgi:hypothetical protein
MVRKSKIRTLFLLPFASIIFLTGWCLQFVGPSKKVEKIKKESYDMHIEVIEPDEQLICQTIKK